MPYSPRPGIEHILVLDQKRIFPKYMDSLIPNSKFGVLDLSTLVSPSKGL